MSNFYTAAELKEIIGLDPNVQLFASYDGSITAHNADGAIATFSNTGEKLTPLLDATCEYVVEASKDIKRQSFISIVDPHYGTRIITVDYCTLKGNVIVTIATAEFVYSNSGYVSLSEIDTNVKQLVNLLKEFNVNSLAGGLDKFTKKCLKIVNMGYK